MWSMYLDSMPVHGIAPWGAASRREKAPFPRFEMWMSVPPFRASMTRSREMAAGTTDTGVRVEDEEWLWVIPLRLASGRATVLHLPIAGPGAAPYADQ
jgi:hypothetical protein